MFDKLKEFFLGAPEEPFLPKVSLPIDKAKVEEVSGGMKFKRTWECEHCVALGADRPSRLSIRAREDRADGPSNYALETDGTKLNYMHATLPTQYLTWNGLAEERGWQVHPTVKCPPCQHNMSRDLFKRMVREGKIERR